MNEITKLLWRYHLRITENPACIGKEKRLLFEELEKLGYQNEYDLLLTWDAISMSHKPYIHNDFSGATISGSNIVALADSIRSSIRAISQSPQSEGITKALKTLTEAVQVNHDLLAQQQAQALGKLSFIADEAALPKDKRHHSVLEDTLNSVPKVLSSASSLIDLWNKLSPHIFTFFQL